MTNVTVMKGSLQRLGRNGPAGASDSIGVATETLDELRLERLELLKITDGDTALDVLDGAADTLWRLRPMLFLGAPDEPMLTRLAHRAKEFSYRCWRTESALFTPENFNRRDTDIFAGGTALALLAIPEEVEVDIPLEGCVEL